MTPRSFRNHVVAAACPHSSLADLAKPIIDSSIVFEEIDGILSLEAEHFHTQTKTDVRKWYVTSAAGIPDVPPDPDPEHLADASGGAYVELLPDTRQSHADTLVHGENFADQPGVMAVLHYNVHFNSPGRYYVWIRAYSTNSEDDSVHVGLDGEWPESGLRWRTTINDEWGWQKKRRNPPGADQHGSLLLSYLDVGAPGPRELQISMREDGAELDKIVLARDPNYVPQGQGPQPMRKP